MQVRGTKIAKDTEVITTLSSRKPPISPRKPTTLSSSSFVRLEREKAAGGQRSTQIKELACSKIDMGTDTPQFEPLSDEEENKQRKTALIDSKSADKKKPINAEDQAKQSPSISPFSMAEEANKNKVKGF